MTIDLDDDIITGHSARDEFAKAHGLVEAFLQFVREHDVGNDLIDEIELPVPRGLLVKAFCIVIVAERRPESRTLLIKAGIALAHFQPGLGPRIRVRPCPQYGRGEDERPKPFARRIARTLDAVAADRVRLADTYLSAITRSLN